MADSAEFVIRLIDRATGPARRISASMKGVNKALKPIKNDKAFQALDRVGTSLFNAGKQAAFLGAAVLGLGSVAFAGAAIKAGMFAENTELAFKQLTGSAAEGQKAWGKVTGLVERLGLDLHDTTEGFRELLAAQFSIGEADQLIRMTADLRVIGVEGEKAKRVLMALTQIRAKGKVQQEELLQLAEAGISLSLVMEELGRITGKTKSELATLQQKGLVGSDIGLEAIKAAVKRKLHVKEFGEVGQSFSENMLSGMLDRLKSAGQLLLNRIGQAVKGATDALKPLVKDLTEWMDSLDADDFTDFIETIIGGIRAAIPMVKEFLIGFGQEAQMFAAEMRAAFGGGDIDPRKVGREVAKFLGLVIKALGLAIKVLRFFTTPVGKAVAALGLFVLVAVKVIAAVSAIATAVASLSAAWVAVGAGLAKITPALVFIGKIFASFASAVAGTAAAIVGAFVAAAAAVFSVGVAIRDLVAVVSLEDLGEAILGSFRSAGESVINWINTVLTGQFAEAGRALIMGLVNGVLSSQQFLVDTIKDMGTGVLGAAKETLGIASPSKEFEKLGRFSGQGFAKGLESVSPTLQSSSADAIAQPALAGGAAAAAGGGGNTTISISVPISIEGAEDAGETARATRDILASELGHILESLTAPSPEPATT